MSMKPKTELYAVRGGTKPGVYDDYCLAHDQVDDDPTNAYMREFDNAEDALRYVYGSAGEYGHVTTDDGRIVGLLYDDEAIVRFGPKVSETAQFILAVQTGSVREVRRTLEAIGMQALGRSFEDGWHALVAKWKGQITNQQSYRIVRAVKKIAGRPD